MTKELSKYNRKVQNCEIKVVIREGGKTKQIMKVNTNTPNFKHGEIMVVPRKFKSLSTEEKRQALQAMADAGLSRIEMSCCTGLSEGRISQLIGKRRGPHRGK